MNSTELPAGWTKRIDTLRASSGDHAIEVYFKSVAYNFNDTKGRRVGNTAVVAPVYRWIDANGVDNSRSDYDYKTGKPVLTGMFDVRIYTDRDGDKYGAIPPCTLSTDIRAAITIADEKLVQAAKRNAKKHQGA